MTVTSTTHLNFRGDARAALEFYRAVFDGRLTVVTYRDAHSVQRPEEADLVMWGQVESADGFRIMAYDAPASRGHDAGIDPFFESLRATTLEEATAVWEKLADGATVKAPFGPSDWSPAYGMLTDRFGVTWIVDVAVAYESA